MAGEVLSGLTSQTRRKVTVSGHQLRLQLTA